MDPLRVENLWMQRQREGGCWRWVLARDDWCLGRWDSLLSPSVERIGLGEEVGCLLFSVAQQDARRHVREGMGWDGTQQGGLLYEIPEMLRWIYNCSQCRPCVVFLCLHSSFLCGPTRSTPGSPIRNAVWCWNAGMRKYFAAEEFLVSPFVWVSTFLNSPHVLYPTEHSLSGEVSDTCLTIHLQKAKECRLTYSNLCWTYFH